MNDEKYEYREIDGERVAVLKNETKNFIDQKKLILAYKKAGIPSDYWNLGFQHAKTGSNKDVAAVCRSYYDDIVSGEVNYSLYIYGDNSTSKTTVACAVAKKFIEEGKKVKFIIADHLIDLLLKTSGYGYIEELEKEKEVLLSCDFLVIDDGFDDKKVLTWNNNPQIISRLDSFLRYAVQHGVKIAATSNIPLEKIERTYGRSMYELLDRNFKILNFAENIKSKRKQAVGIDK